MNEVQEIAMRNAQEQGTKIFRKGGAPDRSAVRYVPKQTAKKQDAGVVIEGQVQEESKGEDIIIEAGPPKQGDHLMLEEVDGALNDDEDDWLDDDIASNVLKGMKISEDENGIK